MADMRLLLALRQSQRRLAQRREAGRLPGPPARPGV